MSTKNDVVVFQLGFTNWRMGDELASAAGIIQESRHVALSNMSDTACYSLYPSEMYDANPNHDKVRVVKMGHAVPRFDGESLSVGPEKLIEPMVSWESLEDDEIRADLARMETICYEYMCEIEDKLGCEITFALAQNIFATPVVLSRVMKRRVAEGKKCIPIVSVGEGTALGEQLKLFSQEQAELYPHPRRFYPIVQEEGALWHAKTGVQAMFLTSKVDVKKFQEVFQGFPENRIFLCPESVGMEQQCAHIRLKTLALLEQLKKSQALEAREQRVKERAYFIHLETGCCDAEKNYNEALKLEEAEEEKKLASVGGA
eukprot:TRINITY_DN23634_c0_g1_i1.p1 TRINITY_DN23634_c0_g1~~TRINITY_DN23634_c0_g1_i1.p1  ORF type:complete len:316 (-),score=58.80 TRINITY_DN23634_c0_g1_i1:64-1011(-)